MGVVVCLVVTTLRFWFCGLEFPLRFGALNLARARVCGLGCVWFLRTRKTILLVPIIYYFGFIFVVNSGSLNNITRHEMATFGH